MAVTRDEVVRALDAFIDSSSELTNKAWAGPMSSGTVASHVGGVNFSRTVCDYAAEHAPDGKVFVWSICPRGERHKTEFLFRGTRRDWLAGDCPRCQDLARWREQAKEATPTFRQLHPNLVAYLADPADADSRGELVGFVCSRCGEQIPWSPRYKGLPMCIWCRDSKGRLPGQMVLRRGGGDDVQLEEDLAVAIGTLGFTIVADHGIVTERNTYVRAVIKPDILLPALRVAVELDNSPPSGHRPNNHDSLSGIDDDQRRDRLLGGLGWRVLRIRRPDQPTDGAWPWRVETTSQSPRKLADLVGAALDVAGLTHQDE